MLHMSGIDYHPEFSNDPNEWVKYEGDDALMAANMGVYIVDGLYEACFLENRNGYLSFMAGKSIAESIRVGEAFEEIVFNKLEDYEIPNDIMIRNLNCMISDAEKRQEEYDAMRMFSAFIAGSYIEKQYILFNSIHKISDDLSDEEKLSLVSRLVIITANQIQQLPDLLTLVSKYNTDGDKGILYEDLTELNALCLNLNLNNNKEIESPNQFNNDLDIQKVRKKVNEIHRHIVNG